MLRSLAKIAVGLDIDNAANRVVELFYKNRPSPNDRLARPFQILAYHKVSPESHPFFSPLRPAVFEEHVRFLKRCYRVLDLQELAERSSRGDVPERAVAITFDDGYRDNYEYAFPILKKYGLPATIFVATGAIGTGELLWHDRIFDSFRFTTRESARVRSLQSAELALNSPHTIERSLRTVLLHTKALYGEERTRFIEEVEQALNPQLPGARQYMLSWPQIQEMHRAGIAFGSHTVSHPVVSRLPREELTRELRISREHLSERLSAPVRAFAYPNGQPGDYNDETKAALKDCGYTCAVTCGPGSNRAFMDPYELRRAQPWHEEIEMFRLKFFFERHGLKT